MSDEPKTGGYMAEAPMSADAFRRHPVASTLRESGYLGEVPSDQTLDRLELDESARRAVKTAAKEAAELHATGDQAGAWRYSDEAASAIVGTLPEAQRDPDYLAEPTPQSTDPRELARNLPRY